MSMLNAPEPISPAQARARLQEAIRQRLGEDWREAENAWLVVHESDYLIRLNKGVLNLDFQCDLLGVVSVSESPANPVQMSGRLIAWMVLGASLLVALAIANALGVLG